MKQQAPPLLPAILLAVITMKIIYGKDRYGGENHLVFNFCVMFHEKRQT